MTARRLVADAGGTNVRFALADPAGELEQVLTYRVADFASFMHVMSAYLAAAGIGPDLGACAIAAAGPVDGDFVKLTNNPWSIDRAEVSASMAGIPVALVNDVEGVAAALPHLGAGDADAFGGPAPVRVDHRTMVALNVGTGINVASAIRRGGQWWTCPGEAGHMTLGLVEADGIEINYLNTQIEEMFYRFINFSEFDVSEISSGKYTSLISQGDKRFVGIPVFPSRVFRQSSLYLRSDSKITKAEQLAGKTIGYERAERVALLTAFPVTVFMRLAHYPVSLMDWLANGLARLAGVVPSVGHRESHTPEEVKLIVAGIRKRGMLGQEQEEMIHSVFDLHRMLVREIMVPRTRITCLPHTTDLDTLLAQVVEDQHSRIPIYEGNPDHILGILYTKDLLRAGMERRRRELPMDAPFDLRAVLHQPMIVPESMSLMQMLRESRRRQAQMALVVDEFGTFVGLVTIEDVLEQIVGEIQDEYDEEEKAIRKLGENVMVVDASLNLRELADDYDLALPRGEGYETLGGFVLARLGFVPKGGETFVFEGRRFTVVEMEGHRVARVKVEKLTALGAHSDVAASLPKSPSA